MVYDDDFILIYREDTEMMLNKLIPEVCHSVFTGLSLMPSVDNE